MKVYLAARYSRRLELCGYRTTLQSYGLEVTSRWLNGDHQIDDAGEPIGEAGERLVDALTPPVDYTVPDHPDMLDAERECAMRDRAAELRRHFAIEDVADVVRADVLVAFTEEPRSAASRGGRHVELGIALGLAKQVIVVGPRENVFCWLPQIRYFASPPEALEGLRPLLTQYALFHNVAGAGGDGG